MGRLIAAAIALLCLAPVAQAQSWSGGSSTSYSFEVRRDRPGIPNVKPPLRRCPDGTVHSNTPRGCKGHMRRVHRR